MVSEEIAAVAVRKTTIKKIVTPRETTDIRMIVEAGMIVAVTKMIAVVIHFQTPAFLHFGRRMETAIAVVINSNTNRKPGSICFPVLLFRNCVSNALV